MQTSRVKKEEENVIMSRIEEFYKSIGLTENKFSSEIGVPQKTLNNYANGRTLPLGVVYLILEKFPALSAEWLMRGTGSMYADRQTDDAESRRELNDEIERLRSTIDNMNYMISNMRK